jgi:type I restriction enzyme, S subunit
LKRFDLAGRPFAVHVPYQQLKEHFREEDTMGSGTIFKAVTKKDVYGIKFLKADEKTAAELELRLWPLFRLLEVLTLKNTKLRTTRDFLLPKFFRWSVARSSGP